MKEGRTSIKWLCGLLGRLFFCGITPAGMGFFFLLPFFFPPSSSPLFWKQEPFSSPSFPTTKEDQNGNGIPDAFEYGLARKFAPCLAITGEKIWPVEVKYLFASGKPLIQRSYAREKNRWVFQKEKPLFPASPMEKIPFAHLPRFQKEEDGREIFFQYYVDGPGENLGSLSQEMSWASEFERLQGDLSHPAQCSYPPTQYVHFFWDRGKRDVLAIQYWFYFPYDKFLNSHEGDWEHITLYLQLQGKGRERLDPERVQIPIKYRFYFHRFHIETREVLKKNNHLVVFVGGWARQALPQINMFPGSFHLLPFFRLWSGSHSGGCYPRQGSYSLGGFSFLAVEETVEKVSLFISSEEFRTVLLSHPGQIDSSLNPSLDWLSLPLTCGSWESLNWPGMVLSGSSKDDLQPAFLGLWEEAKPYPLWRGRFLPGIKNKKGF